MFHHGIRVFKLSMKGMGCRETPLLVFISN